MEKDFSMFKRKFLERMIFLIDHVSKKKERKKSLAGKI